MVDDSKEVYMQQAIGCLHQCPSCGKYCDKEDGHGGKCQITTGHQICSMGGKVWRNKEEDMAAVLITCDDYKEATKIEIPGRKLRWEEFKDEICGWDWDLTKDENYRIMRKSNREKLQKIWNKFGRGIWSIFLHQVHTLHIS